MMFNIKSLTTKLRKGNKKTLLTNSFRYGALFLLCGALTYSTHAIFELYVSAQSSHQQVSKLRNKALELSASLSEETALNKTLNDSLEKKTQSLEKLNQRIDDMENILGLSDDNPPQTIKQRVDTAAINSAVKATLFQLIPNGKPTPDAPLTSGFGTRVHPITKQRKNHDGLDFGASKGTPIYAPADAVIEKVNSSQHGYGNQLILNHAMGFVSTYSHMSKFNVKAGQFVNKGELIGWTGNSGLSTGPHLHYEIHFLGKPLNPRPFVDWDIKNFDTIFKKEPNVQWASLLNTVGSMVEMQVQLASQNHEATFQTVNQAKSNPKQANTP
ncbi:M23 family metallopeptidase [Photobacterium angustum]|uniref:M23 family metallopeptidase n=1 Tax=Photobacterium angustum TaxID=661 RepID=UPI0005DF3EB2|nr:M23 family metallopeptidase [Photobacterium angustum]KJG17315.1 peptidase M23 [Photobacterium angustum]KJG23699.1 peptidase M23 [Photobacterium angustum]KJG30820.1 peptidase M23 [Photobacterium angustum]PSW94189.1 M23 family peptidase [Photobacterium angustum]PSX02775.1 M23 family peptidase [Photobacterium angustum]